MGYTKKIFLLSNFYTQHGARTQTLRLNVACSTNWATRGPPQWIILAKIFFKMQSGRCMLFAVHNQSSKIYFSGNGKKRDNGKVLEWKHEHQASLFCN